MKTEILWTVFAAAAALEFVFVPWFLKAMWPEKTTKSLLLKMVCATLFVCMGVCAMLISGNTSLFAQFMLAGLVFGWGGDFFLHVSKKLAFFILGLVSFLTGHLCYLSAYISASHHLFPEKKAVSPVSIVIITLLFAAGAVFAKKKKMHFGKRLVPVIFYALTLMSMLVLASALGLRILLEGQPGAALKGVVLAAGALLFFVSDSLWAAINFTRNRKNRALKNANIITYFAGQMLLASTILLIQL